MVVLVRFEGQRRSAKSPTTTTAKSAKPGDQTAGSAAAVTGNNEDELSDAERNVMLQQQREQLQAQLVLQQQLHSELQQHLKLQQEHHQLQAQLMVSSFSCSCNRGS